MHRKTLMSAAGLMMALALAPASAHAQPADGLPGGPVTSDHGNRLTDDGSTTQPASAPRAIRYVIQPGDTLGEIALRFRTTVAAVQRDNGISSPDRIVVGRALRIVPGPDFVDTRPPSSPNAPAPSSDAGGSGEIGLSHYLDPDAPVGPGGQPSAQPAPTHPWGPRLAAAGREAVISTTAAHRRSIEETGVGLYYGDHSSYHRRDAAGRREWIRDNMIEGTNPPTPRQASCIGWALDMVGRAYEEVGRGDVWRGIRARVVADGARGTTLAKELVRDGWTAVYFNPDSRKASDGNAEHTYTAAQVRRGRPYYGIRVSDSVIDYRPSHGSSTTQSMAGIDRLEQAPFWFGLAKGGMHTFVGHENIVSEFHWTSNPDDPEAMEETPLEEFAWLSGVIVVPPTTWPQR